MVTPLRDGMNLVAKEYVAAQDPDDPGVLILSHFAGAAEEMKDALIVNPYDIEKTADAIRSAMEMSLEERQRRHRALLALIEKNDITSWCQSFLGALSRASSPDDPANWHQPEAIRRALENLRRGPAGRQASKLATEPTPTTLHHTR